MSEKIRHGDLVFYHAPNTRSTGTRILLEELGAHYELHSLDIKAAQQRDPAYLEVNPLGKVPAIMHDGALVTEQPAIFLYLADLFPEAGLAPKIGDPLRGPYLRWMVFYGSCFEPALVDRSMKREPAPASTSPYGDWEGMFGALLKQLGEGPWLLGDRFTAADVLWGTALRWTTMFKLVPEVPSVMAYVARVGARPATVRVNALDAALSASQTKR